MESDAITTTIVAALGLTAIIVFGVGVKATSDCNKDLRFEREKIRAISSTTMAIGLLLWPILFHLVVGAKSLQDPYVAIVFAWPIVLIAFDLYHTGSRTKETESEEHARNLDIKNNGIALVGGAWAIGALLAAITDRERGHSKQGSVSILISLLIAIALLIPSADAHVSSSTSIVVRSAQKCLLNYAVGLFVAGVVIAWRGKGA